MNPKNLSKLAHAYALKNAVAYDGKAVVGSVISPLFLEGLKKEEVKEYLGEISKIVAEINKLSLEEQKKEFEELRHLVSERKAREGLPELPLAKKGKVIMRFAPAPSAPLHVGHAMTASLSYLFVKKYGGKFYLRIEDTNPEAVEKQFYSMIEKDSKWLFPGKFVKFQIQSDNMKKYYQYVEKLIKNKTAYVCTCLTEKFKKFSDFKENCPCRNNDLQENIYKWKKMLGISKEKSLDFSATAFNKNTPEEQYKEGDAVVRFKSGMQNLNPAMRDFPLARINLEKHPRQGKKYRVWPLMNLAVTVDDIETKMTHIIRAKDQRDNAEKQKLIYKSLKKKFPWTAFLGKIKFKDIELSKRKLKEAIAQGKYSGWDDPNIPTVMSLRKRGYKPEAFYNFAEQIGLSENDKVIDKEEYFKLLNAFNK